MSTMVTDLIVTSCSTRTSRPSAEHRGALEPGGVPSRVGLRNELMDFIVNHFGNPALDGAR